MKFKEIHYVMKNPTVGSPRNMMCPKQDARMGSIFCLSECEWLLSWGSFANQAWIKCRLMPNGMTENRNPKEQDLIKTLKKDTDGITALTD